MKLKVFNASTQRTPTDLAIRITITPRNGVFFISAGLAKLLQMEADQKYSIAQDEDRPQDWYLLRDENGMTVRAKKNDQFVFSNRKCAQEIASNLSALTAKRIAIKVGEHPLEQDGTSLYPLITKGAVIK